MTEIDRLDMQLLREIADLHEIPSGAYNIRKNGESAMRNSTENIEITSKTDKSGIDIRIRPGTKNESVHIPVIVGTTGYKEAVYNDFFIGEDCDVLIVAGCGIHNMGCADSEHDGIHAFYIGPRSRVRYVEKHYGEGDGSGKRILNPVTEVYLEKDAIIEIDMAQLRGVDSTERETKIVAAEGAEVLITERLLTHGQQLATSKIDIILNGKNSSARVISRSVAQDASKQIFFPRVEGNNKCFGHVQCDSIIMGEAKVQSIPAIEANHVDAQLIHEAAIGRIAGDQILKLMTLGLTEEEAEEQILNGFLK